MMHIYFNGDSSETTTRPKMAPAPKHFCQQLLGLVKKSVISSRRCSFSIVVLPPRERASRTHESSALIKENKQPQCQFGWHDWGCISASKQAEQIAESRGRAGHRARGYEIKLEKIIASYSSAEHSILQLRVLTTKHIIEQLKSCWDWYAWLEIV